MDLRLKNQLRDIFNKHDVAGIYFDKKTNYDEYDPEINQLIFVLNKVNNLSQMQTILSKIFERMFWKGFVKKKDTDILAKELYSLLKEDYIVR